MKKIYIAPKIDVIILDTLCDATLQTCSVFKGKLNDECISHFDVVARSRPRTKPNTQACGESRTAASGATINTPLGCHSS